MHLRTAGAQAAPAASSQAGSKTLGSPTRCPGRPGRRERDDMVYAPRVPQGTVATQDWLANELAEHGEIDAAYRDRI